MYSNCSIVILHLELTLILQKKKSSEIRRRFERARASERFWKKYDFALISLEKIERSSERERAICFFLANRANFSSENRSFSLTSEIEKRAIFARFTLSESERERAKFRNVLSLQVWSVKNKRRMILHFFNTLLIQWIRELEMIMTQPILLGELANKF